MPITRIPEPYVAGFNKIKEMSAADAEAFAVALEKSPPNGGMKGMIATVGRGVPRLKPEDVEDMVRSLYSLYVYRGESEAPLNSFVSELTNAARVSSKGAVFSEADKEQFQSKMKRLLDIEAVTLASKIGNLRVDYAKTFHDARIMTDLRPIFAKPEDRPVGVSITHTLKIEYHEEGDHKNFYVSLDVNDLEKLKRIVERAETKASSLQSMIKSSNLQDLSQEKSQ